MARRRNVQTRWLFPLVVVVSAALQGGVGTVIEATREAPWPRLMVDIKREGKGDGLVLSSPPGIQCGEKCTSSFEPGTRVTLTAIAGEGSTFQGFSGPCLPRTPAYYRWAFEALFADDPEGVPLDDPRRPLYEFLGLGALTPPSGDPRQCVVSLDRTSKVLVEFGEQPEEVEIEWVAMDDTKDVVLPNPAMEAETVVRMDEPPAVEPPPVDVPPTVEPPPELALAPPAPQVPMPETPAEPTPDEKPAEVPDLSAQRMKAVEVPDENEVKDAPDDAQFLSDKNRDVAEQTHAKDTNLDRQLDGESSPSEKSDVKSDDIGGEEDRIAQLEEAEASSLEAERLQESLHTGEDKTAKGVETGEEGGGGEDGENGDGSEADKPGMLSMRGIEGRGAPGGPMIDPHGDQMAGRSGRPGQGGKQGRRGKRGKRGIKTELEFDDYQRIVGKDKAEEEIELARRQMSQRRGRWEKKMAAIKSSLENFTPEVRPGNQTALKTRAAPFAVYIARMHRRIHELWGFGFLEDMDGKPASNEMNDWKLHTKLEIIINPDGTVDKVNIAKPSGVLTFDAAAIDTILTAGPFEAPPDVIRSADGKTYMHWNFHRDWRQCGTFGAEPFILTTPRKGQDSLADSDVIGKTPRRRRNRKREPGVASRSSAADAKATKRATSALAKPNHPQASHAANMWLTGFTRGDVQKMLRVSAIPFSSGGQVVANSGSEMGIVYQNILKETKGRTIREWKLVSAAGYRKRFGQLPQGVKLDGSELFLVVRLKKEQFTVVLREHPKTGEFKIVGFQR